MRARVEPGGTRDLDQAAKRFRLAERKLHEEMFRAHRAGSSLRTIALATDYSHETVRVCIKRIAAWIASETAILERPEGAARSFGYTAREESERAWQQRRARLDHLLGVKEADE